VTRVDAVTEVVQVVSPWLPIDQAAAAAAVEELSWLPATDLPDAEIAVLMWVREPDGATDWWRGWWDGECWRAADHGGEVAGVVTHWAEPAGPLA